MIRQKNSKSGLIIPALLIAIVTGCTGIGNEKPTDYVDPDIGGVGLLLQPTRPTVQLPNRPVRVYPSRGDYLDDRIDYFPLSLISHRNGELFGIMPFTGDFKLPVASAWDNQLETVSPFYLSTWLQDYDITVEFTPSAFSGIFRITFPEGGKKGIYLLNRRDIVWNNNSDGSVTGIQSFNGMKAWVYATAGKDFEWRDTLVNNRTYTCLLNNNAPTLSTEFRYSISYISGEQAKQTYEKEIKGVAFDEAGKNAENEWDKVLGRIKVEGGNEQRKRVFYTALYRCFERMVDINEGGRYYSNYDTAVHNSSEPFYVDDWVWDTYLAHHPLRIILEPEKEAAMIRSYIDMYRQSGWLPTFPVLYGDTPCMNGFHSSIMILDAWRKGVRDFDAETAYEAMRKNSLEATMLPWRNGPACELDTFYRQKGFYPALHPGEVENVKEVHSWEKRQSVAVTLGHSYDDWAVAEMATELGKGDDAGYFSERALNYRKLWHPEKRFFMPKDSEGEWIDIDPLWDGGMGGRDYYDENNGWTYLWQVQHNLPDLIELMGGKKSFEKRLDELFTAGLGRSKYETWAKFPDFSGIVGQFSMGNEPSFHIPYLYNLTAAPWKTQKRVRMLLDAWFTDNIFGIPGDEDGGGMSAFVVFSCMGFYPLTPGIPEYTVGTPAFEKVTIELGNSKTFVVEAPGAGEKNKYIQSAELNGKKLERPFFSHSDLMAGGVLRLEMGPYPSKELWSK